MKRNITILVAGTLFLLFFGELAGVWGEEARDKSSLSYGVFVDSYIEKCEAMSKMLDSGSPNIRKDAMKAAIKGDFIRSNRTALIDYLKKEKPPLDANHVEYHLTLKFVESADPVTLKFIESPDLEKGYALLEKERAVR